MILLVLAIEYLRILIQLKMAIKYLIVSFRLNKNMLLKRFTCLHFLQSSFMVDIIVCVRTRWDEDKNAVLNMQYSRLKVRLNRGICLVSILEVHKTQNIYFESFKVHLVVLRKCDISFCQRLSKSIYGLHKRPFYHKELNLLRNLLYLKWIG